jgi:serine/threonine protein kinase
MARRNLSGKTLNVDTKKETQSVQIVKRIEPLKAPLKELFSVEADIHDGGEQCRIKRVRAKADGVEYVMKIQLKKRIRGANEALFRRMTERMMNMPDSHNVVKIINCFEDHQYFYTVLEACNGGDLFDFFRMLMSDDMDAATLEREVRTVTKEILISLAHLHKEGLVHKDVKLENLVFKEKGGVEPRTVGSPKSRVSEREKGDPIASPKLLKLIDFDFTEEWEPNSPRSKAVVGTDGYIAPEAYLGDVCPKSDVFSTGVVMYVLVAGRFPYDDDIFDDGPNENYVGSPKMKEIYDKLAKYKVRFGRAWDHLPEAKEFCRALLTFDMGARPSADEALQHPWMKAHIDKDSPKSPKSAKSPKSPKSAKSPK